MCKPPPSDVGTPYTRGPSRLRALIQGIPNSIHRFSPIFPLFFFCNFTIIVRPNPILSIKAPTVGLWVFVPLLFCWSGAFHA